MTRHVKEECEMRRWRRWRRWRRRCAGYVRSERRVRSMWARALGQSNSGCHETATRDMTARAISGPICRLTRQDVRDCRRAGRAHHGEDLLEIRHDESDSRRRHDEDDRDREVHQRGAFPAAAMIIVCRLRRRCRLAPGAAVHVALCYEWRLYCERATVWRAAVGYASARHFHTPRRSLHFSSDDSPATCQSLVINRQSSVISHQSSVISHQSSAMAHL